MNTIFIVANWKEYPDNRKEAVKIASVLGRGKVSKGVTAVVCPPHVFLDAVAPAIKKGKYVLGAQDLSPLMIGAYTGEVSPKALASLGVKYAIIGHSERRAMGEDDNVIVLKLKAAHAAGIRPILCVGEKSREDAEKSHAEVRDQLAVLGELSKKEIAATIIAYEPVWAVGAKQPATPEDAREMRIYIQKVISDMVDDKVIASMPILYGGSVAPKNAQDFITTGGMQGLLIGRASIDPKSFKSIVDVFTK